uniref:Uncharacterized protein n=1 Tax=Amphiprion percula TaxID=161767 RepID=A0A3P8TI88_AMPPE
MCHTVEKTTKFRFKIVYCLAPIFKYFHSTICTQHIFKRWLHPKVWLTFHVVELLTAPPNNFFLLNFLHGFL